MKTLNRILIVMALVSLIAGCGVSPTSAPIRVPDPDYWPTAGWRSSTPEEQGMDSALLTRMFERIEEQQLNLRSVLVVRNGYLVTEAYFHPYTRDTSHSIQSITKSVVGMLIGLAIDRGYIEDVNQPLLSFYPGRHAAHLDVNKQSITLEHVLSLTAGLDCHDTPGSTGPTVQQSQNWVSYMLDLPMSEAPGTKFNYCTGAVHLLSAIIQRATGMNTREFANEYLFKPLGIPAVAADQWITDPQGIPVGGYGLYLTPHDLAKLGFLYLHAGKWEGKQIVPADFVAASTTAHATKDDGNGYGYLWTVYPAEGRYAALGLAEQHIHVVPRLNLVVVFTSGLQPFGATPLLTDLLNNYIIASITSTAPLPANPNGVDRLEAHIQAAANPKQPVPPLPDVARNISGRKYGLDENPASWQTMTLTFQEGADTAAVTIESDTDSRTLSVGLDNLYRTSDVSMPGTGGLRGRWESEDAFVVEEIRLGEIVEYEYRLTFVGNELNIAVYERIFGGSPGQLHGTLESG